MKPVAPAFDGTQPCASVDPELFFPEGPSNVHLSAKRAITPICGSCEFSAPCLDYALKNDVQGLWAGTTEPDRKAIRRKKGIKIENYLFLTMDKLTR